MGAKELEGGVDCISDYSGLMGDCLSGPHLLSGGKWFFDC